MPRRQGRNDKLETGSAMVLMLGTADWDQAIATNQHYMARELASQWPVVFSESLGLRRPDLTRRDLARMFRRVLRRRRDTAIQREIPLNLSVAKPVIVPIHNRITRPINQAILRQLYKSWVQHDGPRVLWTYSPLTYGFESLADITVYHCVDLLGEFPQISQAVVSAGETNLARNADLAVASSVAVQAHLDHTGFPRVLHWPNVADVSKITRGKDHYVGRIPGRAVFAGNFSDRKVDFGILGQLLDRGVELHLAGPISEGGGNSADSVMELVRNGAVYHGLLSLEELAKLYWTSSVGLVPYVINSYTMGVNPLKTFEYLAAGLHVVSTAVPAVEAVPGHVSVASDADSFVSDVLENAGCPSESALEERVLIAGQNSWDLRGAEARNKLCEMIDGLGN